MARTVLRRSRRLGLVSRRLGFRRRRLRLGRSRIPRLERGRLRLGHRGRRNRALRTAARRLSLAVVARLAADVVRVAVLAVLASLVPALGPLADELCAALVAPALLLCALAVVADNLGAALFAGALAVVAVTVVVVVADDQLVPIVVLVGAGLRVAAFAVADDTLALALLVVVIAFAAGLVGGAVVAVAGDLLPAPFGRRAELGGDGHGLDDSVAEGAVRDVGGAGGDCAGCGAGDCACVCLMGGRAGELPSAVAIALLLLAGVLVFMVALLVMVFAEPDVQAQGDDGRWTLFVPV